VKNSPPKSKNSQPVASVEERKNSPQNIMNSQPVIAGEEKKNSPSNIKRKTIFSSIVACSV
jgi:hypothetical protein